MKFSLLLFPPLLVVFLVFLKIGFIFFGGGYVIIPVMHRELVSNMHLITEQAFIDGIALSQLTPGPIAMVATFAGYSIAGVLGGLVGTFAMFLPGSALMFFISSKYEQIKSSNRARAVLNAVIPAVVGLLISASFHIGQSVISSIFMFGVFVLSVVLLVRYKVNPIFLIFVTALMGVLFGL